MFLATYYLCQIKDMTTGSMDCLAAQKEMCLCHCSVMLNSHH